MSTSSEKLAGVGFNPSGNPDVDKVKSMCAEMIELVGGLSVEGDMNQLVDAAVNNIITAQMWVVKCLTYKP